MSVLNGKLDRIVRALGDRGGDDGRQVVNTQRFVRALWQIYGEPGDEPEPEIQTAEDAKQFWADVDAAFDRVYGEREE